MRNAFLFTLLLISTHVSAQIKWKLPKPKLSGFYIQWGYNRDRFARSDIHFKKDGAYDFTLHKVHADEQPDFSGFRDAPLDITIPQNSYRIGAYLNKQHTWAIEINFDHAKYVVHDDQTMRVTGEIYGVPIDKDTIVHRQFVHFEHTNGANFYHVNYVHQHVLLETGKGRKRHELASYLLKGGAGILVPRSDVTLFGHQLDNEYHVAGYIISAEVGARIYPLRNFFLEVNGKGGFANYLDVLAVEGGKAHHHFWYVEVIGLVGYDINLPLRKKHA